MILQTISRDSKAGCRPSPCPGIWFTRNGWIIGSYAVLKALSQNLRTDTKLSRQFSGKSGVRVGRRDSDKVPDLQRGTRSFRTAIDGKSPKPVTAQMAAEIARRDNHSTDQRFTEQYDAVKAFYSGKTLEAHHIVEKSILGELKVNQGDLSDTEAPCILIAAELHQQFFTKEMTGKRDLFAPPLSPKKRVELLRRLYTATPGNSSLYTPHDLFSDIHRIAKMIIDEVAKRLGVSG